MKFSLYKTSGILRPSQKMVEAVLQHVADVSVNYYTDNYARPKIAEAEALLASVANLDSQSDYEALPDPNKLGINFISKIKQIKSDSEGKTDWSKAIGKLESFSIGFSGKKSDQSIYKKLKQYSSLLGSQNKIPYFDQPDVKITISREGLGAIAKCVSQINKLPLNGQDDQTRSANRKARALLLKQLSRELEGDAEINFRSSSGGAWQKLSPEDYRDKRESVHDKATLAASQVYRQLKDIKNKIGTPLAEASESAVFISTLDIESVCSDSEGSLAKSAGVKYLTLSVARARTDELGSVADQPEGSTAPDIKINFYLPPPELICDNIIEFVSLRRPLLKKLIKSYLRSTVEHELVHVLQLLRKRGAGVKSQLSEKMKYDSLTDVGEVKENLEEVLAERIRKTKKRIKDLQSSGAPLDEIEKLQKLKDDLADSAPLVSEFDGLRSQYKALDAEGKKSFPGLHRMRDLVSELTRISLLPPGIDPEELRITHHSQDDEFFSELVNTTATLDRFITAWVPDEVIGALVKVFAGKMSTADLKALILQRIKTQSTEAAEAIASASNDEKNIKNARSGAAWFAANNYLGSSFIAALIGKLNSMLDEMPTWNGDNPERTQLYIEFQHALSGEALAEYRQRLEQMLAVKEDEFLKHLRLLAEQGDEVARSKWQRAVSELYSHAINYRDSKFSIQRSV